MVGPNDPALRNVIGDKDGKTTPSEREVARRRIVMYTTCEGCVLLLQRAWRKRGGIAGAKLSDGWRKGTVARARGQSPLPPQSRKRQERSADSTLPTPKYGSQARSRGTMLLQI
jgi:hypothetical protein